MVNKKILVINSLMIEANFFNLHRSYFYLYKIIPFAEMLDIIIGRGLLTDLTRLIRTITSFDVFIYLDNIYRICSMLCRYFPMRSALKFKYRLIDFDYIIWITKFIEQKTFLSILDIFSLTIL